MFFPYLKTAQILSNDTNMSCLTSCLISLATKFTKKLNTTQWMTHLSRFLENYWNDYNEIWFIASASYVSDVYLETVKQIIVFVIQPYEYDLSEFYNISTRLQLNLLHSFLFGLKISKRKSLAELSRLHNSVKYNNFLFSFTDVSL